MKKTDPDIDWSKTTWEGSRREKLRRWQKLSIRERLQAVEDMGEIAQRFKEMREQGKFQYPRRSDRPGRE